MFRMISFGFAAMVALGCGGDDSGVPGGDGGVRLDGSTSGTDGGVRLDGGTSGTDGSTGTDGGTSGTDSSTSGTDGGTSTGTGEVGSPCTGDGDCDGGLMCMTTALSFISLPGGYCSQTCTGAADCGRSGYECRALFSIGPSGGGDTYCLPPSGGTGFDASFGFDGSFGFDAGL
jgi:hypothetical protein